MGIFRLAVAVAACGLMVATTAQDAGAQNGATQRRGGRGGQRMARQEHPQGGRVNAMAQLNLTEEQQIQLQALREAGRAEMEALRGSGEGPTREQMEEMRTAHREKVAQVLTADQFAQLAELRANASGGRQEGRRGRGMRGENGEDGQGGRGRRGGRQGKGPANLAEALDLTADQQDQFAKLRAAQRAEMEARRETGERPSKEEMEAIREAHRTAIQSLLTDEQQATLKEMRANRPGRRGEAADAEDDGVAKPATSGAQSSSWGAVKQQVEQRCQEVHDEVAE